MEESKIATLYELVKPLIDPQFDEVIKIAHQLTKADIHDLVAFRHIMTQLAGYLFFVGSLAGYYIAQRRKVYATAYQKATGTIGDKEAVAVIASADERQKEEIFSNMFMSIRNQIDALKKVWEIKQIEFSKSGKEV